MSLKRQFKLWVHRRTCRHDWGGEFAEFDNSGREWQGYVCSKCHKEKLVRKYTYRLRWPFERVPKK